MIEDFANVEPRIDRVLTQYRESPKLLHMLRTYLRQIEEVQQSLDVLPEQFNIDTAVGDQLTLLGKRMGFPRRHCVCEVQPVFGFECGPSTVHGFSILGFCSNADWQRCADFGITELSIDDDEIYRKFLLVRRYQMLQLFDRESLLTCLKILWGPTAKIMHAGRGRVIIAPGRDLDALEQAVLQLYPRVLPVGLGVAIRFHFGSIRAFGFGEGWGGFCDSPAVGEPLVTEELAEDILTEKGEQILVELLGASSDWMCQIDVRPYDC